MRSAPAHVSRHSNVRTYSPVLRCAPQTRCRPEPLSTESTCLQSTPTSMLALRLGGTSARLFLERVLQLDQASNEPNVRPEHTEHLHLSLQASHHWLGPKPCQMLHSPQAACPEPVPENVFLSGTPEITLREQNRTKRASEQGPGHVWPAGPAAVVVDAAVAGTRPRKHSDWTK